MNEFAQPAERILKQGLDDVVADYLGRVRAAAASLDPVRREELIDDLREHIATARAELSPETDAGVRTLLDRLGDPAAIVAEASAGEPAATPPPATAVATPPPATAVPPRSNRTLLTVLIVVLALFALAPIAVCIGGLLYFLPVSTEIQQGPLPVEAPTPAPQSS
jgi:hypothetical protein